MQAEQPPASNVEIRKPEDKDSLAEVRQAREELEKALRCSNARKKLRQATTQVVIRPEHESDVA